MAQSIRNIIEGINEAISARIPGVVSYGVAYSVERDGVISPVVDERSVTFDDSYAIQIYHKIGEVTVRYAGGFGDSSDSLNTFDISAVILNNERLSKLKPDELGMILQSVLYNNISPRILPKKIILNNETIFGTEYRGLKYSLNEYFSLLQINYQVEIKFRSGCFDLCPEDFQNCKTL